MHSVIRFTLLVLLAAALAPLAASGGAQEPAQEPLRFVPPLGHAQGVRAAAFSADGRHCLTGSADGTARLWEVETGRAVHTFVGHSSGVSTVAFSPDGRHALTGSGDWTLRLWELEGGREVRVFTGQTSPVEHAAFSPDGERVFGIAIGEGSVWEVATGRREVLAERGRGVAEAFPRASALDPDRRRIAMGYGDGVVRLRDVETGEELRVLEGHDGAVPAVAFSPDGRLLASGGNDGRVRVWDADTGAELRVLRAHSGGVWVTEFSPDGRLLASAGGDKVVRLWEVETGRETQVLRESEWGIGTVAFSPDGRRLLSSGALEAVQMWDLTTGQLERQFRGATVPVYGIALSRDGEYLATGSSGQGAGLWRLDSGPPVRVLEAGTEAVQPLAFSADGSRLLTCYRAARVWDTATGTPLQTFEDPLRWFTAGDLSPDGRSVLLLGTDGALELRDVESGRPLPRFEPGGGFDWARPVALSPNGRHALTPGPDGGDLALRDVVSGDVLQRYADPRFTPRAAAFSADGARIAAAGLWHGVRVWETGSGRQLPFAAEDRSGVRLVVFNPVDSRLIAAGSEDGGVRLWDVERSVLVRTFRGHAGEVQGVAFSPDGRRVISAGRDGTVRVWEAATGEPLLVRLILQDQPEWLLYTPDGRFDGTEAALAQAHFARGLETVPAAELAERFHVPGLAGRVLGGG